MAYIGREPAYGAFSKQTITADSSTTTFTLNFVVGSTASILVVINGAVKVPDTDYTIASGGSQIVFTVAPTTGQTVFVTFLGRSLDVATFISVNTTLITGQTSLTTGVQGADTLLIYDDSALAFKKIALDDLITGQTELAEAAATDDYLLIYDTSATEIKKIQRSNVGATLNYSKGTFTGDGSTTTITINSGRAVDNVLVFVNGICLVPTDDYTIASTTLTFATAPTSGAEITVRYLPI
jgi:hypothetical protein